MTFKWTYLLVAVVVLAAVLAPALTGGVWGSYSYAQGVALILLGGFLIWLVRRTPRQDRTGVGLSGGHTVTAPFVGYPKDRVLAVFDHEDAAKRATESVRTAGYRDVERYAGRQGAIRLDSQGNDHGVAASAERTIEHLASDASDLEEYDVAVRDGRIVLAVLVEDGERRHDVGDLLRRHGGQDVRYFGSLSVETLSVDPSRTRAD